MPDTEPQFWASIMTHHSRSTIPRCVDSADFHDVQEADKWAREGLGNSYSMWAEINEYGRGRLYVIGENRPRESPLAYYTMGYDQRCNPIRQTD